MLVIVKPETVVRWHRKRFASCWTRLSRRSHSRQPGKDREIRELMRRIANANVLWGAPPAHGELLKLGINISERTVSRWMPRRRKPPSQTWRTFLDNQIADTRSYSACGWAGFAMPCTVATLGRRAGPWIRDSRFENSNLESRFGHQTVRGGAAGMLGRGLPSPGPCILEQGFFVPPRWR